MDIPEEKLKVTITVDPLLAFAIQLNKQAKASEAKKNSQPTSFNFSPFGHCCCGSDEFHKWHRDFHTELYDHIGLECGFMPLRPNDVEVRNINGENRIFHIFKTDLKKIFETRKFRKEQEEQWKKIEEAEKQKRKEERNRKARERYAKKKNLNSKKEKEN